MQSSEKMENIITDLDYNVKFSYMGAPRSFPEHWHEFAEFIIATDNNGSYSVGNEQYHLDTGDLLLIWPGEMHSNISVTSNSSLLLQFGDNFIYNCHDLMINYRHFKTYHKIGREDMTELNEILTYHMKEAYHIFKSHDPFTETACTIQIYSMLMALGKYIYNNINKAIEAAKDGTELPPIAVAKIILKYKMHALIFLKTVKKICLKRIYPIFLDLVIFIFHGYLKNIHI